MHHCTVFVLVRQLAWARWFRATYRLIIFPMHRYGYNMSCLNAAIVEGAKGTVLNQIDLTVPEQVRCLRPRHVLLCPRGHVLLVLCTRPTLRLPTGTGHWVVASKCHGFGVVRWYAL